MICDQESSVRAIAVPTLKGSGAYGIVDDRYALAAVPGRAVATKVPVKVAQFGAQIVWSGPAFIGHTEGPKACERSSEKELPTTTRKSASTNFFMGVIVYMQQ